MSPVMPLGSVRDTQLWRRLNEGFQTGPESEIAAKLAANLPDVCHEASERMKAMPAGHPQFTLHDEVDLLRVTELMWMVMPETVREALNAIETALLILAAFWHDQGMVLDADAYQALGGDPDYIKYRYNWELEHPNLGQARERLQVRELSEDERQRCQQVEHEMSAAVLSDWLRATHGEHSARWAVQTYGSDQRLTVASVSLAGFAAELCSSHTQRVSRAIVGQAFNFDENIGSLHVCLPYLALVLRLADILDFDRDRTPDSLYKTIHFTNAVSIAEWEKHRSVQGWTIRRDLVQFTMGFDHPEYQRTAERFMDYVDQELADAMAFLREFPAAAPHRELGVASRVDRTRMSARNDTYIYCGDLEFSLSRDEIVRILMTDRLYRDKSLCVRELIQNSMDALRHRKAATKRDTGADWSAGKVTLEHTQDDRGRYVVRCTDNGMGMDEGITQSYLTKVGRSYYRSPDFEREKATLSRAGVAFDPCARFGIGFMSCFMLGDEIRIHTRRWHEANGPLGKPLKVEISGLGGLMVLRLGDPDQQPGTTVEIVLRDHPVVHTEWTDEVHLVDTVRKYAVACEFPVEATCAVPGIEGGFIVDTAKSYMPTELEDGGINPRITIARDFGDVDQEAAGQVRASFLSDEHGRLAIGNSGAGWVREPADSGPTLKHLPGGPGSTPSHRTRACVSLDGILVCGEPARDRRAIGTYYATPFTHWRESVDLDARGSLKPELTPARTPPDAPFGRWAGPGWRRLTELAEQTRGRLWEEVAELAHRQREWPLFWDLAAIHQADPSFMRAGALWSYVRVPVRRTDGTTRWVRFRDLPPLAPAGLPEHSRLLTRGHGRVELPEATQNWWGERSGFVANDLLTRTVAGMSAMRMVRGEPRLAFAEPTDPGLVPGLRTLGGGLWLVTYMAELNEDLCVAAPIATANRHHPLTQIAWEARHAERRSLLQTFATRLIHTLSRGSERPAPWEPEFQVGLGHNELGRLFGAIGWADQPEDWRPPWTVRTLDGGVATIDNAVFAHWASAVLRR